MGLLDKIRGGTDDSDDDDEERLYRITYESRYEREVREVIVYFNGFSKKITYDEIGNYFYNDISSGSSYEFMRNDEVILDAHVDAYEPVREWREQKWSRNRSDVTRSELLDKILELHDREDVRNIRVPESADIPAPYERFVDEQF